MTRVILASSSPTRARLLEAAGVAFECVPAHVDEAMAKEALLGEGAQPREIADALAELKAIRVSQAHPGALVIGSDQVLEFQGEALSKCADMAEARALLRRLAGRTHVQLAAAAIAKDGVVLWRHVGQVELAMRGFSDGFLDDYLHKSGEEVLGTVGCYRFESFGIQLFASVKGDYFTILGLPLLPVLAALREFGVLPK